MLTKWHQCLSLAKVVESATMTNCSMLLCMFIRYHEGAVQPLHMLWLYSRLGHQLSRVFWPASKNCSIRALSLHWLRDKDNKVLWQLDFFVFVLFMFLFHSETSVTPIVFLHSPHRYSQSDLLASNFVETKILASVLCSPWQHFAIIISIELVLESSLSKAVQRLEVLNYFKKEGGAPWDWSFLGQPWAAHKACLISSACEGTILDAPLLLLCRCSLVYSLSTPLSWLLLWEIDPRQPLSICMKLSNFAGVNLHWGLWWSKFQPPRFVHRP